MRRTGLTVCILCSKAASKIVISSAPMEMPKSAKPDIPTNEGNGDPVANKIERKLPSIVRMVKLIDENDNTTAEDPSDLLLKQMVEGNSRNNEDQIRLAIAQVLKDVDYPRVAFPANVQSTFNQATYDTLWTEGSDDLVNLLLSLGVDVKFKKSNLTLLHLACRGKWSAEYVERKAKGEDVDWRGQWIWREAICKRLIDSGCDWSCLQDGSCPRSSSFQPGLKETTDTKSMDEVVRRQLLEYAHLKDMKKDSGPTEIFQNLKMDIVVGFRGPL
jgi:hypothetical protein